MAADIQAFTRTFPTGGTPNNLTTFNFTLGARIVRAVEFMIPYGNRGAVKFALAMAGTQVIPSNVGEFLNGDNQLIHWPVTGYPTSGAWQLIGYNNGSFIHDIQVRFLCDLPQDVQQLPPRLIPSSALSG